MGVTTVDTDSVSFPVSMAMMSDTLLNCLISLTLIASVRAIIFKPTGTLLDEVKVHHISSSHGHRHRRSPEGSFPTEMHFQFTTKGHDINLRLKRSLTNQASDIPVFVIRSNKIVQENLPPIQNAASYLDRDMGASVLVGKGEDGNFTLEGTYYDPNGRVHIHPGDGPVHVISRAAEVNYGNDFIFNPESDGRSLGTASVRAKRRTVNEYTIGILMCADYKDYSHWKKHFKNETLVKSGMRQFYATVAQSMSLRYASVHDVDPRLKISIHITGLLIIDYDTSYSLGLNVRQIQDGIGDIATKKLHHSVLQLPTTVMSSVAMKSQSNGIMQLTIFRLKKNPGKSYWTENEVTDRGTVEVKPALRSFKDWVRRENNLPPSDHWMLFSGYDLSSNGSKIVAGLATLAAMCTQSSVSIIEQDFSASVGATASHELGHCLSAFHDGSPYARSCPDSDNYIMSSKLVNPTENATASRPWEFSKCSVRAFRRYLARVYCARKPESSTSAFDSPEVTMLKPGQVYSSDVQCRLALGNESYFGRGIQYDRGFDSMCRAMYCSVPGRPRYFQKMFAMEKTSCGDGKWCIKGRCVHDQEAPRTPEFCPQGDAPNEKCKLDDCPFFTLKGKISYCCRTCGMTPRVVLHTLPSDPVTTTTSSPKYNHKPATSVPSTQSSQSTTPKQQNDRPVTVTSPESKPNSLADHKTTVTDRSGPGVIAVMRGIFSTFGDMFGGDQNGDSTNPAAGKDTPFIVTPRLDNTSSGTPNVGSWLSQILRDAKPGVAPTNVKFIPLNPRQSSSEAGTISSIFFPLSMPDAVPSGGRFVNDQSLNSLTVDSSLLNWINNVRPFSSSISSVVRNVPMDERPSEGAPPRFVLPRFISGGRVAPRWRAVKPIQRATSSGSSDSRSRTGTITVTQTGNSRAFCVSCTTSWSANSKVINRPRLIQAISNRPNIDGRVSWLRRDAIRPVSNINNANFRRILTLPRRNQG